MTGRIILVDPFYETAIHTRVVLDLADGRKIYYWDTRMFGFIKHVDDIESEHKKSKRNWVHGISVILTCYANYKRRVEP